MFKKLSESSQLNIFTSPKTLLSVNSQKMYEDEHAWHNRFRKQVTMRIDDDKPLNLIGHVDVRKANTSDTCFLQDGIEKAQEVFPDKIEAAIFQSVCHYPNAKNRYRGEIKRQMWVNIRCLWVNFVRILKYLKQLCQSIRISGSTHLNFQ